MNSKTPFASPAIAALIFLAMAGLSSFLQPVAQSPPPKPATTWQDLGFNQIPEGLSTDLIALFEGLNEARGTCSFDGETAGDDAEETLKGSLHIQGNPKTGMIPIWQAALGWPADDPGRGINHWVTDSPPDSCPPSNLGPCAERERWG